jgi:hypothetical protein
VTKALFKTATQHTSCHGQAPIKHERECVTRNRLLLLLTLLPLGSTGRQWQKRKVCLLTTPHTQHTGAAAAAATAVAAVVVSITHTCASLALHTLQQQQLSSLVYRSPACDSSSCGCGTYCAAAGAAFGADTAGGAAAAQQPPSCCFAAAAAASYRLLQPASICTALRSCCCSHGLSVSHLLPPHDVQGRVSLTLCVCFVE